MSLMEKSATFSQDRRHRYTLRRIWDPSKDRLAFIGLNPSTADENIDDPTIRRCIGFAHSWGFGGLVMLNIFGYRATDPREMKIAEDPVGPENDAAILRETQTSGLVVAAWGVHGSHDNRAARVRYMLDIGGVILHHLGLTKDGHPKHPLYLRADLKPEIWKRS